MLDDTQEEFEITLDDDIKAKDIEHFLPQVEDLYSCNKCEYDTEDIDKLNYHNTITHGFEVKQVVINDAPPEIMEFNSELCNEIFVCGCCGKGFGSNDECEKHMSTHKASKITCEECNETFLTDLDHEWHVATEHVVGVPIEECKDCSYIPTSSNGLKAHMQIQHMTMKVNLIKNVENVIRCDKCEYSCKLNVQLKKHMEAGC